MTEGVRTHRKYSPSQSERFMLCHGSGNLIERTPPRLLTVYADEGIEAHAVLEAGLLNGCVTATQSIDNSIYCCEPERFDVDFKASVNDALDYIYSILEFLNERYGDAVMWIERYVNPPVASMPDEAGGFCDIAIYSAKGKILYIMDYKHGAGVAKAALGNSQVKQYGAGFLFEDDAVVNAADIETVICVIIQPRAFHPDGDIREYATTPAELFDYLMLLDETIEKCERPDAPLVPGVDQCRFCPARTTCPAAEKAALNTVAAHIDKVGQVNTKQLPNPKTLDLQRLGYIMQMKPYLTSWLKAVEDHAAELERTGVDVPGVKVVEARAQRKYYGEEAKIAKDLAALIGCSIDEVYRRKLVTITDAEQMLVEAFKSRVDKKKRKKAAEDAAQMFAYFTLKESSGNLVLVTDDDPRPAVNKAQQNFAGISDILPPPKT